MLLTALPLLVAASGICRAVDGDTLKCGRENVRLIGIDSPEMPGHCRRGRTCVPGSGPRAKASMAILVRNQPVRLIRFGRDRYGRTLAIAQANGVNLACAQIRSGNAVYKPQWDKRGLIGRQCGVAR